MANDIVLVENALKPLAPHFEQALAGRMPVERLMRTVLVSFERTPKLFQCTQQSVLNAAMSAAVLGLEVDGVTGQAFLIPYKETAQLVIGYKGMNTVAARSGYTVTAGAVREGDEFDYSLGTNAFVKHKPKRGNKDRVTEFWAVADAIGLKPVVVVLSIDEVLAVKAKSPGARKADSPWNEPTIGFVAMGEKTARRRLSRSMPLNTRTRDFILASRMEEAFEEQGKSAHLTPSGDLVIEGEVIPPRAGDETPTAEELMAPIPASDPLKAIKDQGVIAANEGMRGLQIWFGDLPKETKRKIKPFLDENLKLIAENVERQANAGLEGTP